MIERIADTISRYRMFERGHKVGVAVSGGADSICLLHVLAELAPRWALGLSVFHLNHQLRGEESRQDAAFARETAEKLGLKVFIREVDVGRLRALSGGNLEQAARQARRDFFRESIGSGLADRIALGHTLSDQAETVLFRLLRGSGPGGLAGILPVTSEGLVRPLIDVRRAEVEQYLRDRNIPWREDSSNCDLAYARNRIRHELLPALVRDWNPALPEALAHMATLVRDEEEQWSREMRQLAAEHFTSGKGAVILPAEVLRSLALPVARRLVRHAIEAVKGDLRRVGFGHVEAILKMAEKKEGHSRVQVPGLDVIRSFGWIRLAPPSAPGSAPAGGASIELKVLEGEGVWNQPDGCLDAELLPAGLEPRNWRAGDRYQPVGYDSPQKVKLLFQKHRVPLWERRDWPMLVHGETILWSRRFGPAAGYAAGPHSRRVIKVAETQGY